MKEINRRFKLFFLVVSLLINIQVHAQISDSPIKDTLFFTKKSNPERIIILPVNEVEVRIFWKDGGKNDGYITGISGDSIRINTTSNEHIIPPVYRDARRKINRDTTLNRRQKNIRRRALNYPVVRTVSWASIKELQISSRDIKSFRQLFRAGDIFIVISPVLMSFAGAASTIPNSETFGFIAALTIILIDGAIILTDLAFQYIYINPQEWAIGSTFNE